MRAHWEQEKATIERIRDIKEPDRGQPAPSWSAPSARATCEGAARLRYGTLPELERALVAANDALAEQQASRRLLKEEVDEEDIAEVVAEWTGIPRQPPAGGRAGEAPAHGGAPARARGRPGRGRRAPSPTPCAARAPACRTPTGRSARSSSSARPAWARPSWPRPWPSSCSTTSARWSAST